MEYPTPPTSRKRMPDPHTGLLLSWGAGLYIRDRVTVAPLTTTIRGLDAEVQLSPLDGVPEYSVVNLDIIATVLHTQLTHRQTWLGNDRMHEVERALHVALGIALPCSHGGPSRGAMKK